MKALLIILFIASFGFVSSAQSDSKKEISFSSKSKVEKITTEMKASTSIHISESPTITRLYKFQDSRVKKALSFSLRKYTSTLV